MNKNLIFVGLIVLFIILIGLKNYTLTGKNLISSNKAKEMILKNQIKHIIDIRTNFEYNRGYYNSKIKAINIPVNKLKNNLLKNINKNDPIIVYCNTGQRARYATEILKKKGFKNVFYIAGTYKSLL